MNHFFLSSEFLNNFLSMYIFYFNLLFSNEIIPNKIKLTFIWNFLKALATWHLINKINNKKQRKWFTLSAGLWRVGQLELGKVYILYMKGVWVVVIILYFLSSCFIVCAIINLTKEKGEVSSHGVFKPIPPNLPLFALTPPAISHILHCAIINLKENRECFFSRRVQTYSIKSSPFYSYPADHFTHLKLS